MPRVGQVKALDDERLTDRISVGVLTSTFPPVLVDEVLKATGRVEQRHRLLPARVVQDLGYQWSPSRPARTQHDHQSQHHVWLFSEQVVQGFTSRGGSGFMLSLAVGVRVTSAKRRGPRAVRGFRAGTRTDRRRHGMKVPDLLFFCGLAGTHTIGPTRSLL